MEKLRNYTVKRIQENLQEPLDKILEVNFKNTITKMYSLINRLFNFLVIVLCYSVSNKQEKIIIIIYFLLKNFFFNIKMIYFRLMQK